MFTVYVLLSQKNGRIYVGQTSNFPRRLHEHNSGHTPSTRSKGPYVLAYSEQYLTRVEACARERYFKSGKGREFLKTIINK